MTCSNVDELLRRLIGEPEFRKDFDERRESVLEAFELTELERAGVSVLDTSDLIASAEVFVPSVPRNVPI